MSNDKISSAQIILPVTLLALVMLIFLGFQTTILVTDRNSLNQAITQQEPVLTQLDKVKTQLKALAVGTLKFAQQGDKDAMTISAQLKKVGYNVDDASPSAPSAPMPAPATSKTSTMGSPSMPGNLPMMSPAALTHSQPSAAASSPVSSHP